MNKQSCRLFGYVFACVFACFAAFAIAGCSYFNKPLKAEFIEYTQSVKIDSNAFENQFPRDVEGVLSIPSSYEGDLLYYLRNPQLYTLIPDVSLDSSITPDPVTGTDYSFVQTDFTTTTLNFTKDFLKKMEGGGDLNPALSVYEPKTGRTFGPYTVAIRCNSIPESVSNITVLQDIIDGVYVLCFNMPDMSGIHKDITSIAINGENFAVTLGENPASTDTGLFAPPFTFTFESSWQPVKPGAPEFAGKTKPRAVYYKTSMPVSDDENNFTVKLADRKGFTVQTIVSTNAIKLDPPTASPAGGIIEQEDSGYATVTLYAPDADASVHYTAKKGSRVLQGSAPGSVQIQLSAGTWTVEAFARKNGMVDSDTFTTTYTVGATILYVDGLNGSDTNEGTQSRPYKTIRKALETIASNASPSATIRLSSDSTWVTENPASSALLDITLTSALTIEGYGAQRTINASGSGRVLNVSASSSVTIKDIIITGGSADNGAGVYLLGTLALEDNAVITGNTASVNGGGVYAAGTLHMRGFSHVSGNTAGSPAQASNVYLPAGKTITVAGALTGSTQTGVHTQTVPTDTAPVIISDGYAANGGAGEPNLRFVSDEGYAVTKSGSGEAQLQPHGGTITPPGGIEKLTITCDTSVITPGTAKTVTITVKKAQDDGTPLEPPLTQVQAPSTLTIMSGGRPVEPPGTVAARSIPFAGTMPQGIYTLVADVVYQDVHYTESFIIKIAP